MDVGRLLRRRQALRIGHRREVTVIGVADPARARQIGAVFAGAAAASIGWLAAVTMSGSKLSPFGEKHCRSNSGSLAARAQKP